MYVCMYVYIYIYMYIYIYIRAEWEKRRFEADEVHNTYVCVNI